MAGSDTERVAADGGLASVLPGERFNLGFGHAGNAKASPLPLRLIINGHALRPQKLGDKGGNEPGGVSTCLAGEDLHQGVFLLRRGAVINIEGSLPISLDHISWRTDRQGYIEIV